LTEKIFLDYTQEDLDAEYNNGAKVKNCQDFFDSYASESRAVRSGTNCRLDVPYGSHPREKLDIFPASTYGKSPILIFIHGGYWKAFGKDDFSFVAMGFAPAGIAVVIIDYALIPDVRMDELVNQCRRAVSWTWKNAGTFGADRNRLFLAGHSAGGHLVGMLLATDWQRFDGLPTDVIKGGCGISGIYDLEPIRLCYLNDDLHLNHEEAARNSPIRMGPKCKARFLLAVGDQEGTEFLRQSSDMAATWRDRGVDATLKILPDSHHFSIVVQLGNPQDELTRAIQYLITKENL